MLRRETKHMSFIISPFEPISSRIFSLYFSSSTSQYLISISSCVFFLSFFSSTSQYLISISACIIFPLYLLRHLLYLISISSCVFFFFFSSASSVPNFHQLLHIFFYFLLLLHLQYLISISACIFFSSASSIPHFHQLLHIFSYFFFFYVFISALPFSPENVLSDDLTGGRPAVRPGVVRVTSHCEIVDQRIQPYVHLSRSQPLLLLSNLIIIMIMYIYHVLINALSTNMIHINVNMIFYT